MNKTTDILRRVLGGTTFALLVAVIGLVVVHADWSSHNPFGDTGDGGDVSIWVSWNRNPAVGCAQLQYDLAGDAYVAVWVDGGTGANTDRQSAQTGASKCREEDKSPSNEWCGTVTALANFYYIEPLGYWDEIELWRPAEVNTGNC